MLTLLLKEVSLKEVTTVFSTISEDTLGSVEAKFVFSLGGGGLKLDMSKASKNGGIKGLPVGKSFLTIPFRSRKNAPFLEYFALKEAKVHVSWGSFQDNNERKT